MSIAWQLLQERGADALWDRCLGFLDWSVEYTMADQRRRLLDQLRAADGTLLLRQLAGPAPVTSIEQFREVVPLTDYETYGDTLGERDETVLVDSPARWMRTSGRAGGAPKWLPLSAAQRSELGWATLGLFIAARARERGDVRIGRDLTLLNMTAPPPYFSGTAVASVEELDLWPARLFPDNDPELDALPFEERMALGFAGAARRGVDIALSYSSVLAGMGSTFQRRGLPYEPVTSMSEPAAMWHHWRGRLDAWLRRRSLLPRDVWAPRAIIAGGMDAALFRSQIVEQWGQDPLELFGSTDGLFMGIQTWDRTTTTLLPQFNFFEFIPESELQVEDASVGYQPATVLLDELDAGEVYEIVVTNLLGGALMRYRTGELVSVEAMENRESGIALPQFQYRGQRTDLVEIGGFARISERVLDEALTRADVARADWTARKEVENGRPVMHVFYEPPPDTSPGRLEAVHGRLNGALRDLDDDWRDMGDFGDLHPLRISELPPGTFARLAEAGGGKHGVARINAAQPAIDRLLDVAQAVEAVTLRD